MNTKTVGEVFQTRRDLLKLGGLGLLGASAEAVWPLKMGAAEGGASKVHPRGNARNLPNPSPSTRPKAPMSNRGLGNRTRALRNCNEFIGI